MVWPSNLYGSNYSQTKTPDLLVHDTINFQTVNYILVCKTYLLPALVRPIIPMCFEFTLFHFGKLSHDVARLFWGLLPPPHLSISSPLSLIWPILFPYVTPANIWVRPTGNELLSYENWSISSTKKSLVWWFMCSLGCYTHRKPTHTYTGDLKYRMKCKL